MKDEGSEHYTRGHYRRDAAQAFYLLASIIIQMVFRLVGMAMVAQDLDMNANRCPPTAWPEGGGLWHAEFVITASISAHRTHCFWNSCIENGGRRGNCCAVGAPLDAGRAAIPP